MYQDKNNPLKISSPKLKYQEIRFEELCKNVFTHYWSELAARHP